MRSRSRFSVEVGRLLATMGRSLPQTSSLRRPMRLRQVRKLLACRQTVARLRLAPPLQQSDKRGLTLF